MAREIWVVEMQTINDEWVVWDSFRDKADAGKEIGRAAHKEFWRVVRYTPADEGHIFPE